MSFSTLTSLSDILVKEVQYLNRTSLLKRLLIVLLLLTAFVIALYLLAVMLSFFWGQNKEVMYIVAKLNLNNEAALPAWYSTILLFFCALLCLVIAMYKKRFLQSYYRHWFGLFAVFSYLSMDEATAIHEHGSLFNLPEKLGLASYYNNAGWVIFAGIFLSMLVIIYSKFWFQLDRKLRIILTVSAILYIGGAAGIEVLPALLKQVGLSINHWTFGVGFLIAEESGEMLGVVTAIYGFADYISRQKMLKVVIPSAPN